jgi:HSP20 family protein
MANLIRYQDPELSTWTPLDRLSSVRDEMNRLFDWSFRNFLGGGETGLFSGWSPAVDIFQDKDNIYVKSELPGMKKEDINISLHEGMLTISGERKSEEEFKEGETFRSERFFGKFHRSVSLPTAVDEGKVKATYHDGVLTVTLPKAPEAKAKHIEVQVTG